MQRAVSHPCELMLALACLFSTSTTSATGLKVIPAGAAGGTGRDGVAGARPFRADTFHGWVQHFRGMHPESAK